MKRSTLIGLYIDAVPRILTMIQYQSLVQKRREVYGYIERYKQLPVGSILSKDTYEDDIGQHYAAKLAAAASAESIEEFIAGEINIFRLRLKQTTDSDVYKLFISEYLPRLQNPFTYEVQEDKIFVRIDEKNKINWIGEKKNAELASEVMGAYIKHKSSLAIYAHFTKYYTAQEKFAGGFARSGIEGIGSVLTRGFMDLLKNSTQTLYMSGVPRQYIVAQPVVSVASMKLQEKAIPLCISSVLEKLKTKKHLKYDDRSNLNNFLKAAGVPIEDAISLYRAHFNCSSSDFEKKYKYSIQHAYGLVGGRIKYKGVPCTKIISESKKGDCTGCPFAAKSNEPQRECTKTLEKLSKKPEAFIVSPSEYYLRAIKSTTRSNE